MKKMIVINASPRKNKNTATLLKEVQRGAEAADALVYTMNNTPERYKMVHYDTILAPDQQYLEQFFGSCEVLNAFDTWQFPDYDKYDSGAIDVEMKKWYRENQWPKDMAAAFDMGHRMIGKE